MYYLFYVEIHDLIQVIVNYMTKIGERIHYIKHWLRTLIWFNDQLCCCSEKSVRGAVDQWMIVNRGLHRAELWGQVRQMIKCWINELEISILVLKYNSGQAPYI